MKLLLALSTLIATFVLTKEEKVTYYYLSPINDIDANVTESDKIVPIEVKGDVANLVNQQVIVGEGQTVDECVKLNHSAENCKLEKNRIYVFSKMEERNCLDTPFYFNEETNVEFYDDNCHKAIHYCSSEVPISTDSSSFFVTDEDYEKACDMKMKMTSHLKKRVNMDDCLSPDKLFAGSGTLSNLVSLFSDPESPTNYINFVLGPIENYIRCYVEKVGKDVCCSTFYVGGFPAQYREQCEPFW
ncbi:hypothetical protein PIROE2DRAFT_64338 [Piromyces sp. E2]|nr:hypothetical protein PIROE2DRAFT_64338 [Piromyces sp. E2]|eukprot:OUM58546.1 hypothetical protein PIROE2DRAFT_64338 [Piromyces sp. E2]